MDCFLQENDFLHLRDLFVSNGVKDEHFTTLEDENILKILKNEDEMTKLMFISKFNFRKGLMATLISNVPPVEEMEVDSYENISIDQVEINILPSNTNKERETNEVAEEMFTYKENELYHLLNSTLRGQIILGKYKQSKDLEYNNLVDIIILEKLKDALNYVMKPEEFKNIQEQIMELFPLEDPEYFYVPYYRNEDRQCVSARGHLYNRYKSVRKQLKLANIFNCLEIGDEADTSIEDSQKSTDWRSLCDLNRAPYSSPDIIRDWGNSFTERAKILIAGDRKEDVVERYIKSFPCLSFPLGIVLLESDFEEIVKGPQNFSSFSDAWPGLSKKIVAYCKKSKIKDVKEFVEKNKELINEGTHSSILGLLLLPICVTVPKSVKVPGSDPISITKSEISKSFILHVQEPSELEIEKGKYEDFLKKKNLPILPYVIFCGKIQQIFQSYVILNKEKYAYENPVKAVEACFKCLTALRKWPYLSDYVWGFIRKTIYDFESKKSWAPINKLIVQLKKQ